MSGRTDSNSNVTGTIINSLTATVRYNSEFNAAPEEKFFESNYAGKYTGRNVNLGQVVAAISPSYQIGCSSVDDTLTAMFSSLTNASGTNVIGINFDEVYAELLRIGFTTDDAETYICDLVVQNFVLFGTSMMKLDGSMLDSEEPFTINIAGAMDYVNMTDYMHFAGQAMEIYLPTPTHMKSIERRISFAGNEVTPGQFPMSFRPIERTTTMDYIRGNLRLYANSPNYFIALKATIPQIAVVSGVYNYIQQKMYLFTRMLETFMASSGYMFCERSVLRKSAGANSVRREYRGEDLGRAIDTHSSDETNPYLRNFFSKNADGNVLTDGEVPVIRCVESWDTSVVMATILGIISPSDQLPGATQRFVGWSHRLLSRDSTDESLKGVKIVGPFTCVETAEKSAVLSARQLRYDLLQVILSAEGSNSTLYDFGNLINVDRGNPAQTKGGVIGSISKNTGVNYREPEHNSEYGEFLASNVMIDEGDAGLLDIFSVRQKRGAGMNFQTCNPDAKGGIYLKQGGSFPI